MIKNAEFETVASLGVPLKEHQTDVQGFREHVKKWKYPRCYAGGPIDAGGWRDQKLIEYYVSLELMDIQPSDVIIDVASEWSVFPNVVNQMTGAKVYRQDLIYPPGIHGDHIGGSAADMQIPDEFADKLVLHNAFEHFEGNADSGFIREAYRVLKPGGVLCLLPLFLTTEHCILTDPLISRPGIVWDEGARVVQMPWWNNRFGRFYDLDALQRRVLSPGEGFNTTIYYVSNIQDVHRGVYLYFVLLMEKPAG
ncbi:MAG: methyltransferase domain-containing protein [Anaerolineae bacterium]|nr:methyltransferase domain-containing protein [Anaerolineae bacterium]